MVMTGATVSGRGGALAPSVDVAAEEAVVDTGTGAGADGCTAVTVVAVPVVVCDVSNFDASELRRARVLGPTIPIASSLFAF